MFNKVIFQKKLDKRSNNHTLMTTLNAVHNLTTVNKV